MRLPHNLVQHAFVIYHIWEFVKSKSNLSPNKTSYGQTRSSGFYEDLANLYSWQGGCVAGGVRNGIHEIKLFCHSLTPPLGGGVLIMIDRLLTDAHREFKSVKQKGPT